MKRKTRTKGTKGTKLSTQMKKRIIKSKHEKTKGLWTPPKGSDKFILSTGSTLVDQAISGRRFRGGGIPMGIFCEIFGASARGKTVKLLEMAGIVQKMGGDYLFIDPEARVNKEFAKIFEFDLEDGKYKKPNTIEESFDYVRNWNPKGPGPHVVFKDSLAAFESKEESEGKGDEYSGARKAKEFSQELRKITRLIEERNYLVLATNQIRQNLGAGPYAKKTKATGGEAPKFYASLRLELKKPARDGILTMKRIIRGVKHKRIIGVQTDVFVEKSTISTPHQTGLMRILFDYGVDDIVPNLMFLKRNTKGNGFTLNGKDIGNSLEKAVDYIEHDKEKIRRIRIKKLKEEVIDVWTEIQKVLTPVRKRKLR